MSELFGQHMWVRAEAESAAFMVELGFTDAAPTRGSSDGGADVLATGAVAQTKFQGKPVGREPVQRIRGVAHDGRAALFYSWSGYTKGAIAFAADAGVALFDVPAGQPVPQSPAAHALVEAAAEARRLEAARREQLEAEGAPAKQSAAQGPRPAATETQKEYVRDPAHSERLRRAREAEQRKVTAAAERRRRTKQKRAEASARRSAQRESARQRSVQRAAGLSARRAERAAAKATRRAPVAAVPGVTRDIRVASVVATLGVICPVGIAVVSAWFSLRARSALARHGIQRSPNLLRYAAVLSSVGLSLTALMIIGSIDALARSRGSDELSDIAGVASMLAIAGVSILSLWWWYEIPKREPSAVSGSPDSDGLSPTVGGLDGGNPRDETNE